MSFRFSAQGSGYLKILCGGRRLIRALGLGAFAAIAVAGCGDGLRAQQASVPQQANSQPAAPVLVQTGDAPERSKAILAHLNAVIRLYRDTQAPIQKVGEPSDTVYRDQAVALAAQIGGYAFQSAKAEAALMEQSGQGEHAADASSQTQRLEQTRNTLTQRIADLKQQEATLSSELAAAPARKQAALRQQLQQVEGELELQTAMQDALVKIGSMTGISSNDTGFSAQVNQLERSAPGLTTNNTTAVVPAPTLESLSAARNAGVTSQGRVLFELLSAREGIDGLLEEAAGVHQQVLDLHAPLVNQLRATIAQGQALAQTATTAPTPAKTTGKAAAKTGAETGATTASTLATFNQLTAKFKTISAASVPLSQEIAALEQEQVSLQAWRATVNEEYLSILRSLLLRVIAIAIALLAIFGLSQAWSQATRRYVKDLRRRRQLHLVRRLLTGFLSGLVLIFGLVTQFSSLATFAGFITAGIAVGLQTILLSVAAYFFIIGRYGVKVGDRITIAGVTGDVVEVGLVRFYMQEMAGSGTDLYPSGRVAVFSNAVLFQAGTPLYKQMPGTHYAWHEMTVKLSDGVDYRAAVQEITQTMEKVYATYSDQVESQHKALESWMDSGLDQPGVRSHVQFLDGGLQLWVRFPVILRQAASIDDKMTEALSQLISSDEKVKAAISSPPVIKAAVKG